MTVAAETAETLQLLRRWRGSARLTGALLVVVPTRVLVAADCALAATLAAAVAAPMEQRTA